MKVVCRCYSVLEVKQRFEYLCYNTVFFTPLSRLEYLREQCLLTKVCGDSQTNHRPVSLVLRSSSNGKMVTLVFHAGFCDEAETDWKGPGEVLL